MAGQKRNNAQCFTDLEVWRKAHALFLRPLIYLESLPDTRLAVILTDQSIRSLRSVCANIAESFNRSKAKCLNCLDIALGEANARKTRCTNCVTPNW